LRFVIGDCPCVADGQLLTHWHLPIHGRQSPITNRKSQITDAPPRGRARRLKDPEQFIGLCYEALEPWPFENASIHHQLQPENCFVSLFNCYANL
jgi:hypothetical protein